MATLAAWKPTCWPAHPVLQNRQAEDAKQRPPFKRWVAEEVIERQFQ